jgi:hypothetical protein
LGGTASLTHTGAGFQERYFAGGQAAVMNELLAQGATGPPTGEKRLVAVELFLADLAVPGLNPQQHRLPVPFTISYTHGTKYSEGARREARGERHVSLDGPAEVISSCSGGTSRHQPDQGRTGFSYSDSQTLVQIHSGLEKTIGLVSHPPRYTIFNVSKLIPAGAGGVLSFMSCKALTTRSATTRFLYHFRLAGTMYQGARSVLVAAITSSNAAM